MKLSGILGVVLFGSFVFAAPHPNGGLARRIERRAADRATRTTNTINRLNSTTYATDGNSTKGTHVDYSSNWAGAVLTAPPSGQTFNAVSAQFVVPTPSAPSGGGSGEYSASAWVGIDGDTYGNAIWQSGVDFSISADGSLSFDAWYEWFPSPSVDIGSFSFQDGDLISINISSSSNSEGSVTLENLSTGQSVTESTSAPSSNAVLGGQNAEWIVEDFDVGGSQVAFANFGTILFTDASASTSSQKIGTDGADILDLKDSKGNILTDVTLPSSSEVQVVYTGK